MTKHDILALTDEELEMDEVLDSIAWGLCGVTPRKVCQNSTRRRKVLEPTTAQ